MSPLLRAHLGLFLVSILYGANFVVAKLAMPEYVGPFAFILLRVGIGTVFFWVLHALTTKERISSMKDLAYIALCAFFGVALNMLMFFKGLSLTTPINASVMMITSPLFVALIARIYLKEKLSWRQRTGVLMGLGGAFALIAGPGFRPNPDTALGDSLVILNALSYGTYLVLIRPMIQKYHTFSVIKWAFLFGFFLVLPVGWGSFKEIQWADLPPMAWGAIAFVVLGTTCIAYLFNALALKKVSPSVVGSYIYLQPVFSTLVSVVVGMDVLTPRKALFALIVFLGVWLVSVPREWVQKLWQKYGYKP